MSPPDNKTNGGTTMSALIFYGDQELAKMRMEWRVRQWAARRGFQVRKSRSRSLKMNDHGEYRLVDVFTNTIVLGERFDASLDDIVEYLK
jgi:hypothetical protein